MGLRLGLAVRRSCCAALIALAVGGVAMIAPAGASATISEFCGKTYAGNEYCNQGQKHKIFWIEAIASADDFCVMRATEGWPGAPSASGFEYCAAAGSGGYVFQEFHGLEGFAQTHNRHSYSVTASPAFEFS